MSRIRLFRQYPDDINDGKYHSSSGKTPKNNTTGVRGVTFSNGRYIATITFRKQHYYLGRYERIDEAALARKKAEEVLYGEWLEHYEKDMKADLEADYEAQRRKIDEVLRLMREYRPDVTSENADGFEE